MENVMEKPKIVEDIKEIKNLSYAQLIKPCLSEGEEEDY
jgi:hypothetical protein